MILQLNGFQSADEVLLKRFEQLSEPLSYSAFEAKSEFDWFIDLFKTLTFYIKRVKKCESFKI